MNGLNINDQQGVYSQPPPGYIQPGAPGFSGQTQYDMNPMPVSYPPPAQNQSAFPQNNITVISQQGAVQISIPGACKVCGQGYIRSGPSTLGMILGCVFFPLGVICCIMMQERRCSYCRALA